MKLPVLSRKSRSFKEIADCVLNQIEFLLKYGLIKSTPLKGILKSSRSGSLDGMSTVMYSARENETCKSTMANSALNPKNLKFNNQSESNKIQKKINLKQIEELKSKEVTIIELRTENINMNHNMRQLEDQLKQMSKQFNLERQKLRSEI